MTDQKDPIPPGNQKPDQSVNPPIEPANTNLAQPAQTIQEEETMEVHHHAHHSGPRNWKSYLREFFMLFLAVLCGFLAEYQLEHTVEHDREEQYIESMIADMKEDTAKIAISLKFCSDQKAGFDKLLENILRRPYTDSSLKVMYYLQFKWTNNRSPVFFTKRTITQLQYSGGLRLIRNKLVSDSIILYSEDCNKVEMQADFFAMVRMGKVNDYALKLFDNQYLLDDKGVIKTSFFTDSSKVNLIDNNETLIREYANSVIYARGTLALYIMMLKSLQTSIPSKMKFLEESYR